MKKKSCIDDDSLVSKLFCPFQSLNKEGEKNRGKMKQTILLVKGRRRRREVDTPTVKMLERKAKSRHGKMGQNFPT